MLLWIGFAALTAAVVAALLRPLFRETAAVLDPAAADVAVYRDQMAEIALDRERGLIADAEAEAARTEVARRLLALEQVAATGARAAEKAAAQGRTGNGAWRQAAFALGAAVPLAAIALYLQLGSPHLPAQPHQTRLAKPNEASNLDELVAKVEKRLRENPSDGMGWDVIAPVYLVQQRHEDAANAFGRAIALLGESPKRLAGLAEAHVLAANGMVNEAARRAYERLRALEPQRLEPRFWLAFAKEQDGKSAEAAAEYRALLADAPPEAAWRSMVEERLQHVSGVAAGGTPGPSPLPASGTGAAAPASGPGPRQADIDAAAKMSPEQRTAMIERMVEGLAARLKTNGKDVAGWINLVRAYTVMGRRGDAVAALAEARGQLAGDAAALAEIAALEKALGLGS